MRSEFDSATETDSERKTVKPMKMQIKKINCNLLCFTEKVKIL